MSELEEQYKWMVCVRCFTFNHAPYITDALNGFCMQETTFPFVCTIVDDASTDGEQEVIKKYLQEHFDLEDNSVVRNEETDDYVLTFARHKTNKNCYFAVLYLKYNHYRKKSKAPYINEWKDNCKYIALCEGDDYWTDPNKLQKQVDYLESHPKCVLVHTDLSVMDVNTGEVQHKKWKRQKNYNQIERDWGKELVPLILQGKYSVQTLTVCTRMDAVRQVYEEYPEMKDSKLLMGDTPLWMTLATKGTFHFIPEETACYHVISESATHSKNYSNIINFYVSCLYMIEKFAELFDVSVQEKNSAIQSYIYFLLRDIYTDKREYMQEMEEKILQGRRLNIRNAILLKTMDWDPSIKRICSLLIKTFIFISQRAGYWKAKYFFKR